MPGRRPHSGPNVRKDCELATSLLGFALAGDRRSLVPNPHEQEIALLARSWRAEGRPLGGIAQD